MTTMSAPTSFRQVDGFDVHCLYTENDFLRKENQRLRIAHLRRMSDACLLISMQASSKLPRFPTEGQWKRFFAKQNRWSKFRTTCRAEITRLTQPR